MILFLRSNGKSLLLLIVGSSFVFDTSATDPGPALKFIENRNQWAGDIDFTAKIPGGTMIIGPGKFAYYFIDGKRIEALHERLHNAGAPDAAMDWNIKGHAVQVNFIGSDPSVSPLPFGKSHEYYNYYLGDDTEKWTAKAYAYDGLIYPSFYKDIDLKIYSFGQHLKYDFVVAPYGDASQIIMHYQGAHTLRLDNGNLVVKTSLADIVEKRPYVYQIINGEKITIESEYHLENDLLTFCFPNGYDPCYELVIDPLLIFSTYSGFTADNWGSTATPGEHGTLYSSGVTNQNTFGGTFPATTGAFQTNYGGQYDIGILKYDSTGSTLLYATFLGGSQSESPHSLVVNANEELIVLGTTSSEDFPTTPGAYDRTFDEGTPVAHVVSYDNGSDIFVARIAPDGSVLHGSTFLGGSQNDGLNPYGGGLVRNYGDQLRGDVIADDAGNIFISTVTSSPDFTVVNGFGLTYNGGVSDAVLLKMAPDLSQMLWGTFLGGSGADAAHTLKLDADKNIFLAGGTNSIDFQLPAGGYQPVKSGNEDGWIAKVAADGLAILKGTFTGTTSYDQVYFLDLNEDEEIYVYGQTSGNFLIWPDDGSIYSNPNSGQFVQKFDNTLSSLVFSTVFGSGSGVPDISPTAFLVNECNNLYMTGWGGEVNFQSGFWFNDTKGMPVSEDAFQPATSGSDFYFIVLTDNASGFLYGTYLGGTQSRTHVDGGTSRFDKGGIVYHAVCSGCNAYNASGNSTSDFPTTQNAWSTVNNSTNCNNAAFKFDLSSLKARVRTNSVKRTMPGLKFVCQPDKVVFENLSTGGETFEWDLGDGTHITKSDTSAVVHGYQNTGQYLVKLKAIDQGTCKAVDSTFTVVSVHAIQVSVQEDDDLCEGDAYQLRASGGITYEWKRAGDVLVSNEANPSVNPADTTRYFITATDANGCILKDTVQLNVIPGIEPTFELERQSDCFSQPFINVENITDSLWVDDTMFFDFGDGTTSDLPAGEHRYDKEGVYAVRLVGARHGCVFEKSISIPVFKLTIPNIITPGGTEGLNDRLIVKYGDEGNRSPADYGYEVALTVYNRWGSVLYETDNYQNDWSGEDLAAGIYYYDISIEDHTSCKSWLQIVK